MRPLGDQHGEVELDDVILYLLSKEATEKGEKVKISLSGIHNLMEPIHEDLENGFEMFIHFHESRDDVWSQQVEDAIYDVVPYGAQLEMSGTVFLDDDLARMTYARVKQSLSEKATDFLDTIAETAEYRDALEEYAFTK